MLWPAGPIYDEFIRLARLLDSDIQKRIFESGFLLQMVKQVKISYDPRLVPAVSDLIQGRCNYPSDLTKRTELWRNRGKARCKKSVKDGVFFCHLARHQEFAEVNNLPLNWEELPEGSKILKPKPDAERRGHKVDDDPLRPSFRLPVMPKIGDGKGNRTGKGKGAKREREREREREPEAVFEPVASEDPSCQGADSCEVDDIIARLLGNGGSGKRNRFDQRDERNHECDQLVHLDDPLDLDPGSQCVYSGDICRNIGIYEDPDTPNCFFCADHVAVTEEMLELVKQSGDGYVHRELLTLKSVDEKLQALVNLDEVSEDVAVERKRLCMQRYVLAGNNGLGTHPSVLKWIGR